MLVLARKVNEKILIGDNLVITVKSINRGIVSIGVGGIDDNVIHVRKDSSDRSSYNDSGTTNYGKVVK